MTRNVPGSPGAWFSFAVILFYCVINIIAEYHSLNGVSTAHLRGEIQDYFSAASFTYLFRPLLFLLFLTHGLYILYGSFQRDRAFTYYTEQLSLINVLAILLQPLWLIAFHFRYFFTAQCILCCMLIILLLQLKPTRAYFDRFILNEGARFFLKVPLSLFTGWLTAGTLSGFVHLLAGRGLYYVWPGAFGWNLFALFIALFAFTWFLLSLENPAAALALGWFIFGVSRNSNAAFPHDGEFRSLAFTAVLYCMSLFMAFYIRKAYRRSYSY